MTELFPNLHSTAPLIVTLRKRFDEAKAAFDAADAHEDESGEAVPTEIARAYELARHQLCLEEARLATPPTTNHQPKTRMSDYTPKERLRVAFADWWEREGSEMKPELGESELAHFERVCLAAWMRGATGGKPEPDRR